MSMIAVINIIWLALAVGHRLADHGARDHLLWATVGRDYYLDEVEGVREGHLLGFEIDRAGVMRRVLFWRTLLLTELAFAVMYVASEKGYGSQLLIVAVAFALTLVAWTTIGGRVAARPDSLSAISGFIASFACLTGAMWLVAIHMVPDNDLVFPALGSVAALLLTQFPEALWERLSGTQPLDSKQIRADGGVLWLRSFDDDDVRIRSLFAANDLISFVGVRSRFENFIATCVGRLKISLIAVGRPGERPRRAMTVRTYMPQDNWRSRVEQMARDSRAVFFVVGLSEGLTWEADMLIRLNAVSKTLFILPPLFLEAVDDRIVEFLSRLGVPDRETKEISWSMPAILGFYVAPTGHLGVIMGDGRDDINYARMISRFLSLLGSNDLPSQPASNSYANFGNEHLDTVLASDFDLNLLPPSIRIVAEAALGDAAREGRSANVSDLWYAATRDGGFVRLLTQAGVDPAQLKPDPRTRPNPLDWYPRFRPDELWEEALTSPRFGLRAHKTLLNASARDAQAAAGSNELLAALLDDEGWVVLHLDRSGVDVNELRRRLKIESRS